MDGLFNKFGIYDFMGIWGPGAILVTYFMFTLHEPIRGFFKLCGITNPGISSTNLLILLYTAVAYTLGVTLHELGRRIANFFDLFHANKVHDRSEIKEKPCGIHTLKSIQWEYQEKIARAIPSDVYKTMSFDKAISHLKYHNINTSRVDTYHSIYALSRSLTLTFLIHLFLSLIVLFRGFAISFWYFFIDTVLAYLFFIRAYRYHYFWVESVFIQYYMHTRKRKNVRCKVAIGR